MKTNKMVSIIMFITYSFIILLFSFGLKFISNIILELTYLISKANIDPNVSANISKWLVYMLIYVPYGIIIMMMMFEIYDKIRYILIFSVLVPALVLTISLFIISFFDDLNFFNMIIKYIWIIIGEMFVFAFYFIKNIRNCEKSVDKE